MIYIPYYMVRIVFYFIGGIILYLYYPNLINQNILFFLIPTLIVGFFFISILIKEHKNKNVLLGFIGLSCIFLAGYFDAALSRQSNNLDHISKIKSEIIFQKIRLISTPEEKNSTWKITGAIESIFTDGRWSPASGKVNYYLHKTKQIDSLKYNDILLIRGKPQPVEPPRNPKEFDLKKYLSYQNIYHTQFVKAGFWKLVSHDKEWSLKGYASQFRAWAVGVVKKYISTPNEQGIILALVLGVKDDLDDELLKAYSSSGAIHVLAVSGLHVGILYLIIGFCLKPFDRLKGGKWIVTAISLLLLWGYALITNFSPSVLRAVTMFSFFIVSKPFGKGTNIFNTLAGSAFFILIIDPFLIMSVGFQLSYSAVIGIILLQRPIYNLIEVKSSIINHFWTISSVSIAAQIATFPISAHYFHQFPVYFLLSNLLVIDVAFLILNGGLILLSINFWELIAYNLGKLLTALVQFLNKYIFTIEKLPFSIITEIQVSLIQCFALFIIIIGVRTLFVFRQFKFFIFVFIGVALFAFQEWSHYFNIIDKSGLIVYSVRGGSAIEWFSDEKSHLCLDSTLKQKPKSIDFSIKPYMSFRQVTNNVEDNKYFFREARGLQFFFWRNKSILWINNKNCQLPNSVNVDYLIVGHNAIKSILQINNKIVFKNLILDSSNSLFYCERIKKEANLFGKNCFSVLSQGAYVEFL